MKITSIVTVLFMFFISTVHAQSIAFAGVNYQTIITRQICAEINEKEARQLFLVYEDKNLAVYSKQKHNGSDKLPVQAISNLWEHVKKLYFPLDDSSRLVMICHTQNEEGAYITLKSEHRENININLDISIPSWRDELLKHMIMAMGTMITQVRSSGMQSKTIFNYNNIRNIVCYDLLESIGDSSGARQLSLDLDDLCSNIPRKNTRWFTDWYLPIYKAYGNGLVLSRYFDIVNQRSQAELVDGYQETNFGEFIYCWSIAAGEDLKPLAVRAFGWNNEWESQLKKAQQAD